MIKQGTGNGEGRNTTREIKAGDVGAGLTDNLWLETDNLTKPAPI